MHMSQTNMIPEETALKIIHKSGSNKIHIWAFHSAMFTDTEGNVLFNNALNSFYLQLCGVRHFVKDHSARDKTHCHHFMGYSFQLAANNLLYTHSGQHISWPSLH